MFHIIEKGAYSIYCVCINHWGWVSLILYDWDLANHMTVFAEIDSDGFDLRETWFLQSFCTGWKQIPY